MDLSPLSAEQLSEVIESASSSEQLFDNLSQYEMKACFMSSDPPRNEDSEVLSFFYTSFFIAHLLTDQIDEARALTKRMPQFLLQRDSSLQNCLNLLRALWQHKHEQVYSILRELPWSETVKPLVQQYEVYFQNKTISEVSRAYGAIRPAVAASYLGIDPLAAERGDPAVIEKFTSCGWTWDEQTKLLHPKPIDAPHAADSHLPKGLSEIMALIGDPES
ncbi:hypothetical protein MPDQ_001048 [Monascus purpureus]|uniref:CSN8/PSMD8/EIF3K domain-containing protein n=1 Tax=Monascus purpureus TaxID=5098 RepID=A0A507QQD5_MONPU|nr:hypothetical protein MPDQ_001048 [Monascus purpureus]BDD57860.1 hypothetical protein MAP00_003188 [Monascus purpureus]